MRPILGVIFLFVQMVSKHFHHESVHSVKHEMNRVYVICLLDDHVIIIILVIFWSDVLVLIVRGMVIIVK